jgi:uncharacterized lipoprotein YmbA
MKTTTTFGPRFRFRCLLPATLFAGLWAGCSFLPQATEDPTRYYLLTGNVREEASAPAPHGTLHVGVRPVELPGYLLNNRTIVVRRGANEIRYQDYARWAEPLDLAVQQIVRDHLLPNASVASAELAPFALGTKRDYDVSIRVERCEGGLDAQGRHTAQFSANYEITDPQKGGDVVVRKHFTASPLPWDEGSFAGLATALSSEAGSLGDDIAAHLPH